MTQSDSGSQAVEQVRVRPYARLLTMLGEQLIKNDRIALVELIKNSYDADATRVEVDLINFGAKLASSEGSSIAITDDGDGMSEHIIRTDWLNPATPGKQDRKRVSGTSPGGRVLQGEKGIGRFAMFKLGSRVRMITRERDSAEEFVVELDLSFLDESSANAGAGQTHLFIEDVPVTLTRRPPIYFTAASGPGGATHGTRIEISSLRSTWSEKAVKGAFADVGRLQPLMPQVVDGTIPTASTTAGGSLDFLVRFLRDGEDLGLKLDQDLELRRLFDERAVLRVSGHFSEDQQTFVFLVNGHTSVVALDDPQIRGLWAYKRAFQTADVEPSDPSLSEESSGLSLNCGPFDFSFFVFDLTPQASVEYRLDPDEKERVKEHRIYLYRDGVRVLPYGDPDDDWLQLDVMRGTQGAGRTLSNDQVVGFVYISQERNPHLRDKTNREGLLETGSALRDFIALLQITIGHLRRSAYAPYLAGQEQRRGAASRRRQEVLRGFEELLTNSDLPSPVRTQLRQLHKAYAEERDYTEVRLERTEDLAGVGLSVESASHDIVAMANQALGHARAADKRAKDWHQEDLQLRSDTTSVVEGLSFVASRLDDVQGLFVSTRKGKRVLTPTDFVSRVYRMYSNAMRSSSIELKIDQVKPPMKVRTTDAALLQVLVNLFDNSIYWLTAARTRDPMIHVVADARANRLTFADNGPGVRLEDEPYIFEPFFSGKGEAGKGLGLYIARQVSTRSGFTIDLVSDPEHKVESGANFVLVFGDQSSG